MPPSLWRPLHIIPRILIDFIHLSRSQNHFLRFQPFSLFQQLPAYEDNWKDTDHEVGEEEGGNIPLACNLLALEFKCNRDLSFKIYLGERPCNHQRTS
jgi:hypothetical protein